jgi:hypothetical protein
MKKTIIGSALFMGAMVMSHAEFPAEGVALLGRESSHKVSSLKKALLQASTEWEKLSLVDLMFEFICLADISNSPNAAEVLSMPYSKYFSADRSARYVATESSIGTLDPYAFVYMIRPSAEMERLLSGEFEKKNWPRLYFPATRDEYERHWRDMHALAWMYLDAKNNPRMVVLPTRMANPIAYPTNMPLYDEHGEPNEAFFVQWQQNIYDRFTGKP